MKKNTMLITTFAVLLIGSAFTAGAETSSGGGRLVLPAPSNVGDALVRVPVNVDLGGVMVAGRPAELGGYIIRIEFDPTAVQFVDASPGTDFPEQVSRTTVEKANATGRVKLASARPGDHGPSGAINIASVQFRELRPGAIDSIRISIESLSSVLLRDGAGRVIGPAAIPVGVGDDSPGRSRAAE